MLCAFVRTFKNVRACACICDLMFRSARPPVIDTLARSKCSALSFFPSTKETWGQGHTHTNGGAQRRTTRGDIVFQLHIYRVTNRRSVLWYHGTAAPTGSHRQSPRQEVYNDEEREGETAVVSSSGSFIASFDFPLGPLFFFSSATLDVCGNTLGDRTMPPNKQVNYSALSRRTGWRDAGFSRAYDSLRLDLFFFFSSSFLRSTVLCFIQLDSF